MYSEKPIMDKENQNKTGSRDGVYKLFYQHYCDSLRQWKVVKVGLENIITSYCQIKEVFKSAVSIRQNAESKDDRKFLKPLKKLSSLFFGYLYKNGREGASCGEKWLLNRILHTAGICKYLIYGIIHLICSIIKFLVLLAVKQLL